MYAGPMRFQASPERVQEHLELGRDHSPLVCWARLHLDVMSGPTQTVQLLSCGYKAMYHGDQLPAHVQVGVHYVPQPPMRVVHGNKQGTLQLLHLRAWAWMAGYHCRVQAGWDMEAHATHDRGGLL